MSDLKITELTAIDAPIATDIFPLVDDPGGTPATKKSTFQQLADFLASLTQTLTNKTLTSPVIGAITNTDHITITPGTSKLVKIAVLEQGDTTNTYRNNAIILTGWGFLNGNGASTSYKAKGVTFGITFSTLPVVLANAAGRSATGSGATDGLASTWQDWLVGTATAVAVGGFSMNIFQTNNSNLANYDYLYAWIAIGTLT